MALDVGGVEPPGARIDSERQRALALAVAARLDQLRQQRERQVVDRLETQILQDLECRRLAGAGHARHQHQGTLAGARRAHYPAASALCARVSPAACASASRIFAGAEASKGASATRASR